MEFKKKQTIQSDNVIKDLMEGNLPLTKLIKTDRDLYRLNYAIEIFTEFINDAKEQGVIKK